MGGSSLVGNRKVSIEAFSTGGTSLILIVGSQLRIYIPQTKTLFSLTEVFCAAACPPAEKPCSFTAANTRTHGFSAVSETVARNFRTQDNVIHADRITQTGEHFIFLVLCVTRMCSKMNFGYGKS